MVRRNKKRILRGEMESCKIEGNRLILLWRDGKLTTVPKRKWKHYRMLEVVFGMSESDREKFMK